MGDVLSLAVMFDPLLKRFPKARLVVWCHPRNAEVFASDPRVWMTLQAPFPWSSRGSKKGSIAIWRAVLHSAWAVRALKPDVAVDTRGDIRSQAMMLLSGAPRRIGYTTYVSSNLRLRGLLLTSPLPDPPEAHRFLTNLHTLAPLLGTPPPLALPALLSRAPAAQPQAARLIVIHRGAGWIYRRWELVRWVELLDRLQQLPDVRVLQIAGPGELDLAHELSAMLRQPVETVSTNFEGLLATLTQASVFIGLDSGPMNAASLLDVPSVALFGPGIAKMWRPLSRGSAFLQHCEDYPCHPCTQVVCVRPNDSCMTTITVDEVYAAAVHVLNTPPTTPTS